MSMADWFDEQLEACRADERKKTEESMASWFDEQLEACRADERKKTEESMASWFDEQLEACRADERKKVEAEFEQRSADEEQKRAAEQIVAHVDSLVANTGWSIEKACSSLSSSLEEYEEAKGLLA